MKDKDKDCLVYIPHEAPNEYLKLSVVNSRKEIGYRHWFANWFGSLGESTSYPRRKLISKRKKFRVSAPNFELGPAAGLAPSPYSYDLAPSSSPSQPSYSPAETPDGSKSGPSKRKPSVVAPSQSVPGPPPPPPPPTRPAKKNDILMELIIAVASTAVLTFVLVALLFLCCFRRNRSNAVGSRDGPRDEGPLLHLVDLSAGMVCFLSKKTSISFENCNSFFPSFDLVGSTANSPTAASTSRKMFSASSKQRSFLSRVSLKRHGNEFSTADASSAGLPPLKLPPGRSAPPPPAPPPQPPPAPPPKPQPPPPPKIARPPPAPPKGVAPKRQGHSSSGDASDVDSETGAPKTKLKPFFWDKMANPDQKMVWHEISAGSFQ